MKFRHILLYTTAFLLALGLRFIQLGALPLTDKEATFALQALALARGEHPLLGAQPGYILLTSIPFYLFENANFLARFFPALAGSLLVFAPYLFREKALPSLPLEGEGTVLPLFGEDVRMTEGGGVLAAFLLALAPGLVAVSRQANGTMLAVTFGIFAWAAWQNAKPKAAGIFAGIALLGGASVWMGLLIAALTWALAQNLIPADAVEITEADINQERTRADDLKLALKFTGGTLLLVGALFFISPNGLSAFFASLGEFLKGWRFSAGVPISRVLGGLLAYYPLALLFGSIASVRGIRQRERSSLILSLWAAIALLLVIFYPSRQVSDLLWVALPLWVLSAREISPHLHLPIYDRNETFGVFALTVLLLAFSWLNISGAGVLGTTPEMLNNRLVLLGGSIFLLVLSLGLIAIGWSLETATLGGVWGVALMLGMYTLSAAWGSTGLRTPKGIELWDNAARLPQAGLLVETVDSMSTWSRGDAQTLNITVVGINSPALLWSLRQHNVDVVSTLDLTAAPELVITPQSEQIELAATYRGQDFVWRQAPDWLLGAQWAKWLVLREMPTQSEQIILWARNDLFFDSQN